MDQKGAMRGNSRDLRASQIESFLREALAGGKETVVALQEKARAVGLLVEGQSISDAKLFKSAKAALGIRSRRIGFGPGAVWFWILPASPTPEVTTPVTLPPEVYDVGPSGRAPETSPCYARRADERPRGAPLEWTRGVDILQQRPRPLGIPAHRWRLFVDDCKRFVASPWARLAAEFGWNAGGLFGGRYAVPHEHIGSSGLVWSLSGGRILQVHLDGADILGQDGRVHRFHRRPDRAMTFLPWCRHY
jgi:hypothetical protein